MARLDQNVRAAQVPPLSNTTFESLMYNILDFSTSKEFLDVQAEGKKYKRGRVVLSEKNFIAMLVAACQKEGTKAPFQIHKIFTEEGLGLVLNYLTTVGHSNDRDADSARHWYDSGNTRGDEPRRNAPIPPGPATCRDIYIRKYKGRPEAVYWSPPPGGKLFHCGYIQFDQGGTRRRFVVWFPDPAEDPESYSLCLSIKILYLALVYALVDKEMNLGEIEKWLGKHFTAPQLVVKQYFVPKVGDASAVLEPRQQQQQQQQQSIIPGTQLSLVGDPALCIQELFTKAKNDPRTVALIREYQQIGLGYGPEAIPVTEIGQVKQRLLNCLKEDSPEEARLVEKVVAMLKNQNEIVAVLYMIENSVTLQGYPYPLELKEFFIRCTDYQSYTRFQMSNDEDDEVVIGVCTKSYLHAVEPLGQLVEDVAIKALDDEDIGLQAVRIIVVEPFVANNKMYQAPLPLTRETVKVLVASKIAVIELESCSIDNFHQMYLVGDHECEDRVLQLKNCTYHNGGAHFFEGREQPLCPQTIWFTEKLPSLEPFCIASSDGFFRDCKITFSRGTVVAAEATYLKDIMDGKYEGLRAKSVGVEQPESG